MKTNPPYVQVSFTFQYLSTRSTKVFLLIKGKLEIGNRRSSTESKTPRLISNIRRSSELPLFSRRTSESLGLGVSNNRRNSGFCLEHSRKPSRDLDPHELLQRRISEAGMRRASTTGLDFIIKFSKKSESLNLLFRCDS